LQKLLEKSNIRKCNRILIFGAQGTGKSTLAKKITDASTRKVLIVEVDGMEQIWRPYPFTTISNLSKIKTGKYRLLFDFDNKNFIADVINNFNGGIIVFDDAKTYFQSWKQLQDIEKYVARARQYDIEFIFMYHGFSAVFPAAWTYCNLVVLFKTIDSYQRAENKTADSDLMAERKKFVDSKAIKDPHFYRIYNRMV